MHSVYRKEMKSYFISPIPYVLLVIFTAFMGWWFFDQGQFFLREQASLQAFFRMIPWVFLFLIPAITMRLWSEETRGGTLEHLLTAPVRSWQLVAGKFLSAWTLLFICMVATLPLAITVSSLGNLDWGPVLGGYLGTLLLGAALLALGLWVSALTMHQIVAFLTTAILAFLLVVLRYVAPRTGGDIGLFLERLSVSAHYEAMGRGVIDLRDVLYFVSFTLFFLYLNAQAVENRRYR